MEKKLTDGPAFSVLLRFTLPVIAGNLFQLFYTLADTVIVGRTLGSNALAAVGSTGTVIYFVLCFIQGFTGGLGICMGNRCGAGDTVGVRRSAAVSWLLSLTISVILTAAGCLLVPNILVWMQTPHELWQEAHAYLFVVLLGTGATVFYNIISNMLRALGESRIPLIFLVLSSLLNVVLDIVFIVPCAMGVAGAAWATVLSQLIAAALCTVVAFHRFPELRPRRADFEDWRSTMKQHLNMGLPMGFQMSVMCIGQLVMQAAVNALGAAAMAGYTAATKADQLSVLVNNAFGLALSSFVAQNYGARRMDRIRQGVRASLIQIQSCNLLMCAILLLCCNPVVSLFLDNPTTEILGYAKGYFVAVAPFYVLLGFLLVFRTAVQSMDNRTAPFAACITELVMRVGGTLLLGSVLGYTGICLASPLAWLGATALLIPVYRREIRQKSNGRSANVSGGKKLLQM